MSEPKSSNVVMVYIPVIMSDVINSNGLTEDVDFYIERLYTAYHLNTFTKYASSDVSRNITAISAILGIIATVVKIKKDWLSIKKDSESKNKKPAFKNIANVKNNENKKLSKNESYNFFNEDLKVRLSNPSSVLIKDTLIKFKAINFINNEDITSFRRSYAISLVKRVAAKFGANITLVSKETFYCYTASEKSINDVKNLLARDKSANVVIVDTVNDVINAYVRNSKGIVVSNSIKLSDLTGMKENSHDVDEIDKVIKSLKNVKVSKM